MIGALFFSLALRICSIETGCASAGFAADQEDRPAVELRISFIAVRHRAVAPGVGYAGDGRRVTDARLVVAVVGAPERVELPEQVSLLVAVFGGPQPIDRIRDPSFLRISIILSPISLIAWSQPILFHLPPSSLTGYFSRRSLCANSRTDAPLAQCAPRFNGLSKPGSWPIQTPFWTSAMTEQPTEQCVQTDLTVSILPVAAGVAALAFVTTPPAKVDAAAMPPAARPDRRRNARRSIALPVNPVNAFDKRGPFATPFVFFLSIRCPFP